MFWNWCIVVIGKGWFEFRRVEVDLIVDLIIKDLVGFFSGNLLINWKYGLLFFCWLIDKIDW